MDILLPAPWTSDIKQTKGDSERWKEKERLARELGGSEKDTQRVMFPFCLMYPDTQVKILATEKHHQVSTKQKAPAKAYSLETKDQKRGSPERQKTFNSASTKHHTKAVFSPPPILV